MNSYRLLRQGLIARTAIVAVIALLTAACGGGVTNVAAPPPPNISGLYVANFTDNSVTVYAPDANGNVPPIRTIKGLSTGLIFPDGVALDSAGNLYVANYSRDDGSQISITVYARGANGNAVPIRKLSGSNTGLNRPRGIALDDSGNLYVANDADNSVTVYGPLSSWAADGNQAPVRKLKGSSTGLNEPAGITLFDNDLYVANANNNTVTVYGGASSLNGNKPPFRTVSTGLRIPRGVAVFSKNGHLYVTNHGEFSGDPNQSVTVYGAGPAPIRTLAGNNTGLRRPIGVALDGTGTLYVANFAGGNPGNSSITVYEAGANGNMTPIRTISGTSTGLSGPELILLRP